VKINALEELEKKLRELQDRLDRLETQQEHEVTLAELLNDAFIAKHTPYASVSALFEAGGFKSAEVAQDKLDAFVRSVSSFQTWQDLVNAATKEWASKKLGL
jgi:septal ring factor EnvC (AmiA/AmiB activator)